MVMTKEEIREALFEARDELADYRCKVKYNEERILLLLNYKNGKDD